MCVLVGMVRNPRNIIHCSVLPKGKLEEIPVGWRKEREAEPSPGLARIREQIEQQLGCVGKISEQFFGNSFTSYINKPPRLMFSKKGRKISLMPMCSS